MTTISFANRFYPNSYKMTYTPDQLRQVSKEIYSTHVTPFAEMMHWIGYKIALAPFRAFIHCKSYLTEPLPGNDKEVSSCTRTLLKIAAFIGCAITVLPAIPSFLTGMSILALDHPYRPMVSYLEGKDLEKSIDLSISDPLHICSLNASLTPSSVNITMDMLPPTIRAKKTAEHILNDPNRASIIVIEEGWNEDALGVLCNELKKIYPHILHNIAPTLMGMSSGIAVFSQYPFEQVKFIKFEQMISPHHLPCRGVLRLRFPTKKGPLFIYGGIHTQSLDGHAPSQARYEQIIQLKNIIKGDLKKYPHCHQVLMGDFNSSPLDMFGHDNTKLSEQKVLDAIQQHFVDPFLKDHDYLTGQRTNGKPIFLEADNQAMGVNLEEPSASWYDGPSTFPFGRPVVHHAPIEECREILSEDAVSHGYPKPSLVPGKGIPNEGKLGTPEWFKYQSAKNPRYDFFLFPKKNNNGLDGKVEIRRFIVEETDARPPSDHLPIHALLWV